MDIATLIEAGGTVTVVAVLASWVMAERKDNGELWSIIESLVKLRLRQIEDNQESAFMELD